MKKNLPFYRKLHNQVLMAMALGIVIGALWPTTAAEFKPLADGFIKLIRMILTPVIFCVIVSGVSGMGDAKRVGRVGVKALIYFYFVSSLALVLGLITANLIPTGSGLNADPATIDTRDITSFTTAAKDLSVIQFLMNIIPGTMASAFAEGVILQVVLVALFFGFALIMLGEKVRAVKELIDQLTKVIFSIVEMIVLASPIGAFGAIAFTVGRFGLESLLPLMKVVVLFFATCILFVVVVLVPIARYVGFSVTKFCAYIWEEILIFLSISNSEALLPRLMEKLERLGLSKSIIGLVVPTGYSFNLAGNCIYLTLAIVFIAQATNTELSMGQQMAILLVAMLTSKGSAGFTGAGFVTLAATLAVVPSVPMAGLALLLGVDPFMQRGRGLTNYIGNGIAAIVVAAWDRDLDLAELNRRLASGPDMDASMAAKF